MSETTTIQGLSAQETRWLLREVEAVLGERGHTWTLVDGAAFCLDEGPILGLDNLARRLCLAPKRSWGRLVREQLTVLLSVDQPDRIPHENLRLRLMDPRSMCELEYEPLEPLPGLHAVLSAQGAGMTMMMGRLDAVQGDRDDVFARALENLAQLPRPRHVRRRLDSRVRTSWIEILDAEDSYGASRVMVLPDLVRRQLGREIPASGVLVAVPHKFGLWLHFPVDDSVVDTSLLLAYEAFTAWSSEPFPLSPDVYVVSPDMRAEILIHSDRQGPTLDREVMRRLLSHLPPSGPAEAA